MTKKSFTDLWGTVVCTVFTMLNILEMHLCVKPNMYVIIHVQYVFIAFLAPS